MRDWILMISFVLACAIASMSKTAGGYLATSQGRPSEPQNAQEPEEFVKRFKDEKFKDIYGGMMWTLIHDYKDHGHMEMVLKTWITYLEAIEKSEQGDASSLKQLGGIKQLKDELATLLNDSDQAIQGLCGHNPGNQWGPELCPADCSAAREERKEA